MSGSCHRFVAYEVGTVLRMLRHGVKARIAGFVIARQRAGTANGLIFLSIEDETGISDAILDPDLYERNRSLVTRGRSLLVEGTLQKRR